MAMEALKKGQRIGNLLLIELVSKRPKKWRCLCGCGKEKVLWESSIKTGGTKSCGCLQKKWQHSPKKQPRAILSQSIHAQNPKFAIDKLYLGWSEIFERSFLCVVTAEYSNACTVKILETYTDHDKQVAKAKQFITVVPKRTIKKYVIEDE